MKSVVLKCPGRLVFGGMPSTQEMHLLKSKHEVNTVWNLMSEFSFLLEEERSIFGEVLHSPIDDYCVPQKESNFCAKLQEVCFKLEAGHNVFIHCFSGHGRTGMALAAILVKINKLSVERALNTARIMCKGPELESQKDFVRRVFALGE